MNHNDNHGSKREERINEEDEWVLSTSHGWINNHNDEAEHNKYERILHKMNGRVYDA